MAQSVLHTAESRDKSDHGWLKSFHTFSFGGNYNPERIQFGALRVLNDDWVNGGMGFGEHPHDNMEIISIPLSGALQHEDSMNNVAVIESGEIQVMSAGTGIYHKEFNKNEAQPAEFLQIWLFPNKRNVEPRYQQQRYSDDILLNQFIQILSPENNDSGVWIYQDAWFNIAEFTEETTTTYELKNKDNGLYVFMIKGFANAGEQALNQRDGFGIWDTNKVVIKAGKDSKILLMEVPMNYSMDKTEILIICTHDEILKTIVRLIDSNTSMKGTGANTLEQALTLFKSVTFDLILIGAGLQTREEEELIENIDRSMRKVPVVRHFGGGSGLLFTEIYQALGK